jgi:hypothetical protein
MKKANSIFFTACATLALAAVAFATPTPRSDSTFHSSAATIQGAQQSQNAQQLQSVSGTIASVEKTSFTLKVSSNQSGKGHAFVQDPSSKTMTFQIDKNTTLDGTLQVKANADVTYRTDSSGNNIAINVHVTPAA